MASGARHRAIALGLGLVVGMSGDASAAVLTLEPAWVSFPHNHPYLALYGQTVGGAGDVNGDGFDDLVVGAPGSNLDCCQPGAVFVFHGRPGGPRPRSDWSRPGPGYYDGYGAGVGRAGDVNGDGYDDLVFSASFLVPNLVLVYHGSATGLAPTAGWSFVTTPSGTYWPLPATGAGDVNGDGYADVIVGASGYNGGFTNQGRAVVFQGSATGLSAVPDWIQMGTAANEHFGLSVASAGDVDDDGYADVLVASATLIRLYRGSPSGLASVPSWTTPFQPYLSAGTGYRESLGEAAGAGDVDGDGYDDVIVGSPVFSSYTGKVELFRGSAAGLSTAPVWTVQGAAPLTFFGGSVDGAGDVNGDGYADVIVGADLIQRGRALLYPGGPTGPATAPAWSVDGPTQESQFGWSVRGAGDVNGDGRDDVIIGMPERQWTGFGQAFLFLGEPHAPTSPVAEASGLSLYFVDGTLYLWWDWNPSCGGTENSWAIYEGSLGDFTSHVPLHCASMQGASLIPRANDAYYLVVPRSLDFEGSYGKASSGVERPVSVEACRPQSILACP